MEGGGGERRAEEGKGGQWRAEEGRGGHRGAGETDKCKQLVAAMMTVHFLAVSLSTDAQRSSNLKVLSLRIYLKKNHGKNLSAYYTKLEPTATKTQWVSIKALKSIRF